MTGGGDAVAVPVSGLVPTVVAASRLWLKGLGVLITGGCRDTTGWW
jgi:hypothetical protein